MRTPILLLAAVVYLSAGVARAANPLLEVVTQADAPSFLADPGDGRLFISELGGRIRIFSNGQLQDPNDAFLDLSGVVDPGPAGEGGLHSFAFDPDFASDHYVYVAYTRTGSGGSPLESVIERYTVPEGDPNHADVASAHIVLTQQSPVGSQFGNHKGGQLQFGSDGFLYFAFGDGGSGDDPLCLAQTRDVRFGKMLRIDPRSDDFPADPDQNYAVPPGNPFANDPNYAPEIWALGLRNPYRFSFDRETHDLWIGDVGQSTREEVDMDSGASPGRGRNYGWKVLEGTTCHFSDPQAAGCPAYVPPCGDAGYTAPVSDYGRDVGSTVIGGYVYRGSAAAWRGRYIFADFGSGRIFALVRDGADWRRQVLSAGDVTSPISFGEDQAGELYLLTIGGTVYRLRFDRLGETNAQARCIRKLNQDVVALADAKSAQVRACLGKGAAGRLGGEIEACADDSSAPQLTRLGARTATDDAKLCGDSSSPDFGHGGAAAGNDAALSSELDLAHDVFGPDLDAAIATRLSDPNTAMCQQSVATALATCQKARRAEFLRCKTVGLARRTLASPESLASCLESDQGHRIAKACDALTGRIAKTVIPRACTRRGVTLQTAFPGCNTDDPAALASCLDQAGSCRSCQLFDAADALGVPDCGVCE